LAKACTYRLALLQSVGALSDSARRVVTAIRIAGLLPRRSKVRMPRSSGTGCGVVGLSDGRSVNCSQTPAPRVSDRDRLA
jgi:hypothetical protein